MDNRKSKLNASASKNKLGGRLALLGLLVAFVFIYFFVPPVNNSLNQIFNLMATMDVDAVIQYLRSFGALAVVVSFLLMVLSIIIPIPAFLITFANAAIFGWWQGAILSWSSSMVGAALSFFIARILGRDAVAKITTKGALKQVDIFFDRHGKNTVLICRLLPFLSFSLVSYASGLTGITFWSYFIATGIGQLPATIIYSYVGGTLTGGVQVLVTGLLILFAFSALIFLLKTAYTRKNL